MSLFMMAVYFVAAGAVAMIGIGVYAIAIDRPEDHYQTYGICTPSRQHTRTGAYLEPGATQQGSEEMQRQTAEIERLQAVIRQRNRTIKRLRAQREQQPVERQRTAAWDSAERLEWIEIRGQSCE